VRDPEHAEVVLSSSQRINVCNVCYLGVTVAARSHGHGQGLFHVLSLENEVQRVVFSFYSPGPQHFRL
jgi:hypothetical protein